jgi:hypothetical protein
MSTPELSPPQSGPPGAPANGSLGAGILIAWACLIGGYIGVSIVVTLLAGIASSLAAGLFPLLALAPWILMIVFAIRLSGKGQSRTALGIGVGVGSIIGVALLLVAACFGLLSNANFH